jgi:hypothetical protein
MTQAQKTAKAKFKQAIAYRQKTGVSLKEAFAHIYGRKVGAVKKKSASKKGYINLYSKIGDIEKYNGTILGVKIGVKKILGSNKQYELKIYDVDGNHSIINLYEEDKESDIRNDLTPHLYRYIFNKTTQSYTNLQSDVLKKKLFTYLKLLSKELKRLNKKPIKKAAPKKKAAKKVVKKKIVKKVAKKKLSRIDYDKRYQAKKPGKRKSASGNTYYESRPNRSDKGRLLGIGNVKDIKKEALEDYQKVSNRINIAKFKVLFNDEQAKLSNKKSYTYRAFIKNKELAKKYLKELETHARELKKHI